MPIPSSTMNRLAAALADRYRVERELGAGGMATVYLAHDLKHDRAVAIKLLHPDLGAALGSDRFLIEFRWLQPLLFELASTRRTPPLPPSCYE
jgi:predicted unusual protein kinase regulating ubiquinone biosynthesis (AarF/ABC1/UbiB family)